MSEIRKGMVAELVPSDAFRLQRSTFGVAASPDRKAQAQSVWGLCASAAGAGIANCHRVLLIHLPQSLHMGAVKVRGLLSPACQPLLEFLRILWEKLRCPRGFGPPARH